MTRAHTLTALDASFLHVESERTPMHMASVGIFEGGPLYDDEGNFRIGDIRRLITSRLALVPKLRQCPSPGLLGEAPPVWSDDPGFDISAQVRLCRLRSPGTEDELWRLCADAMEVPMERTRPLWDLTFVEGLSGGRVALIERLHHSMADGLAAAELATVLLDLAPDVGPVVESPPWKPSPGPSMWRAAGDDLLRLGALPLRVAKWSVDSIRHPVRGLRDLRDLCGAVGTIVSPQILAPRCSLNGAITSSRSVAFVRLPFEQVHDVARAFDATVNDVLLTMVAGGVRALLEGREELTECGEIQALVPVGLEDHGDRGLRNSVSAIFARLPIAVDDPVDVLRAVSAAVGEDKRRHQALAAATFLRLLEPLPQALLATGAGFVHAQPFFNLIVTNVPGPPVPLYALGAKLLEAFPVLPLAGNQSLSVAALSYEGQLSLGVLSDPVSCPDAAVFCAGVRACHESLVERSQAGTPS
jgi:diacylglycerol O-acyltransferase / wax synthase